jgi:hypothetical protein
MLAALELVADKESKSLIRTENAFPERLVEL